uniref:NADH-ubiquinone oxidoreductase chain 3 n=1 Tax=Phaonia fuscata TaxID=2719084 RepID=A0A7G7CDL5_9MUSC|nr:NADH dehydrogenase subunit 3 [Phaonia fuscata]
MFLISMISIFFLTISFMMMMIPTILAKKMYSDREKNSPFECGFDPISSSRMPFSLRFFLITIIFLIFDVEITLILPIVMIINYSNLFIWTTTSIFFITILLLGLYHEWNQGMLNWSK